VSINRNYKDISEWEDPVLQGCMRRANGNRRSSSPPIQPRKSY